MARRFITVEDIHRANGAELVIDADTVVTPQALEAARVAGVVLRGPNGDYAEPAPNRGPDADNVQRQLPHMPEPPSEFGGATGVVVTAVGRNRAGVLAQITGALSEGGASVIDISQKTVDSWFHLVLTVELTGNATFESLSQRLSALGGEDDFVVRAMHERVFRFMHRV
jgi:ACT domain-containing protein